MIHLTQKDIIETQDLFIICGANPGNPNLTIFVWTKVDSEFRQNGSTLQLPNIQRTSSGTYRCTAVNTYSSGAKGAHSQTMVVNVLCRVLFFSQFHCILENYLYSYSNLSFVLNLAALCTQFCSINIFFILLIWE